MSLRALIFNKRVASNWQLAGFDLGKQRKRGFDSLLTGLSNRDWAFVFNKSAMGGGSLAGYRPGTSLTE